MHTDNIQLDVVSEIGSLQKVLIHSPDGGIGNIIPSKLHDWLYDDIIDVAKTQKEHQTFVILLLMFLDPDVLYKEGKFSPNELVTNPESENYFGKLDVRDLTKQTVLDTQFVLQELFRKHPREAISLIEGICSIEDVHDFRKGDLMALVENEEYEIEEPLIRSDLFTDAVKTLLTGKLEFQLKHFPNKSRVVKLEGDDARFIFPPIPNFIFTRDIGVVIGKNLLITKPRFEIRKREVILLRFIAKHLFDCEVISVSEDDEFFQLEKAMQGEKRVNYEGGDFMMVSPRHLLIGCSERTSPYAIEKLVYRLFWEDTGINIISVIKISEKRSQMHIDTVLTHVRKDLWIMYAPLSEAWDKEQKGKPWREKSYVDDLFQKSDNDIEKEKDVSIFQFFLNSKGVEFKSTGEKEKFKKCDFLLRVDEKRVVESGKRYQHTGAVGTDINKDCKYKCPPAGLEDLLKQISKHEHGADGDVKVIYSGHGTTPYMEREQYTDACNLLALKPGVVVGYDRNLKTAEHFCEEMSGEACSLFGTEKPSAIRGGKKYFPKNEKGPDLEDYVFHAEDLIRYVEEKDLSVEDLRVLTENIQNAIILIPLRRIVKGSRRLALHDNATPEDGAAMKQHEASFYQVSFPTERGSLARRISSSQEQG